MYKLFTEITVGWGRNTDFRFPIYILLYYLIYLNGYALLLFKVQKILFHFEKNKEEYCHWFPGWTQTPLLLCPPFIPSPWPLLLSTESRSRVRKSVLKGAAPSSLSVAPGPSHFSADANKLGAEGSPYHTGPVGPRQGRPCLPSWDHCCPTPWTLAGTVREFQWSAGGCAQEMPTLFFLARGSLSLLLLSSPSWDTVSSLRDPNGAVSSRSAWKYQGARLEPAAWASSAKPWALCQAFSPLSFSLTSSSISSVANVWGFSKYY